MTLGVAHAGKPFDETQQVPRLDVLDVQRGCQLEATAHKHRITNTMIVIAYPILNAAHLRRQNTNCIKPDIVGVYCGQPHALSISIAAYYEMFHTQ
jgi:hypothetical protein